MVSAFIKGVGLGILEGAAEVIESDYDRMKKTQEMLINHHLKKGLEEQDRHTKQQQKVAETLDKLKSITGESDPDKSFEKASQLFDAVGRDIDAANDLFQSTQKAKSIYGDKYQVAHAFDFIEPGQTPRTRDEIIQSFATGNQGIYNADNIYGEVEAPGLLGKIIKPKDITKQVENRLRGLGVETERVGEIRPGVGSVAIKYGYIDPEVAQAYQQKKYSLKKVKAELTGIGFSNNMLQKELDNYDANEKADIEAKIQRNKNLIAQGKQLELNNSIDEKFKLKKYQLQINLLTSQILKNGPDSVEELLVQQESNLIEIKKNKLNFAEDSTEYAQLNKKEQVIIGSITKLTKGMEEERFQKAVGKINLDKLYNTYYENQLSALGLRATYDSVKDRIKLRHNGTSQQEAVAKYRAAIEFNAFASKTLAGGRVAQGYFKQARDGITNQLTGENIAKKIAKKKISNLKQFGTGEGHTINYSTLRNNLTVGQVYDLTGVTMLGKDKKLKSLKDIVEGQPQNFLARGRYAIWTGTNFVGLTLPSVGETN